MRVHRTQYYRTVLKFRSFVELSCESECFFSLILPCSDILEKFVKFESGVGDLASLQKVEWRRATTLKSEVSSSPPPPPTLPPPLPSHCLPPSLSPSLPPPSLPPSPLPPSLLSSLFSSLPPSLLPSPTGSMVKGHCAVLVDSCKYLDLMTCVPTWS